MRRAGGGVLAVLAALAWAASTASAAGPAPLSADGARVAIASSVGNGGFGRWVTDGSGLPAYDYLIDQHTNPIAAQSKIGGSTDAWNAVGNGRVRADAHTGGWVELFDQERLAQWVNRREPAARHYGGGYGFLRVGGKTISTAYDDRAAGASTLRRFGVGSFRRRTAIAPVAIDETVYAPFGDDPALLHDVTITNTTDQAVTATWSEYWDVNPMVIDNRAETITPPLVHRGLATPRWADGALSVAQRPYAGDERPPTIFAAAIDAPASGGHSSSAAAFFGSGTAAAPAGAAGAVSSAPARATANGSTGDTAFVLRAPVRLKPHASVTLRYAFGTAQPAAVKPLIRRLRAERAPLAASERGWRAYVPQVRLGTDNTYSWLSRELQWDAYMLKSLAVHDAVCGTRTMTQGGYYQYALGQNEALRDPLEHLLPLILLDPSLAKSTIRWALQYQRPGSGDLPYGTAPLCRRAEKFGTADELNFWLMLAVVQYVEQTRDYAFLDERVRFNDTKRSATVWEHLRLAHANQERRIGYGSHGLYRPGTQGDTFDLTTRALHLTESTSTTGNFAYIYPQLAALAQHQGDRGFARTLRADGRRLTAAVRAQWQPRGWFGRGFVGATGLGVGTIYADAQYWPLLAGVPSAAQASALVANVRRYLDAGSPVGPTQAPGHGVAGLTESADFFPGRDAWWFVNGPLVWALARNARTVDGAGAYAWDVFQRLTLAHHADAYPDQWSGIITSDDTCAGPTAPVPGLCGLGLSTSYNTQIAHPHAWTLFALFKLAGLDATPDGYEVDPQLPVTTCSVRTKVAGVAYKPGLARGYVRPVRGGALRMRVRLPAGVTRPVVFADGRRVTAARRDGDAVTFTLHARAGRAADWAVRDLSGA
ncbi:MAG TPA: hypothetical protein VNT55_01520 [Baekduia sp.]|nr:hypothetical protein [Baekduia sp.]